MDDVYALIKSMSIPERMLVFALLAPLAGGVLAGVDRKLSARLQGRYGPPLLQPFYDVFKLFGKEKMVVNLWQIFCAYMYLVADILTVVLLAMQSDLLLIFFVLAVGGVFLVIGALAAQSPYSQIGAQRELIQMLTYEPLLILVFAGIYLETGSFKISEIISNYHQPLLYSLPLLFVVMGYAFIIKLKKSPFDLSTSHHAHQELVNPPQDRRVRASGAARDGGGATHRPYGVQRVVDGQRTVVHRMVGKSGDRGGGGLGGSHLHEAEPAGTVRELVFHYADLRNFAMRCEQLAELVFGCAEGKIPNENARTHYRTSELIVLGIVAGSRRQVKRSSRTH